MQKESMLELFERTLLQGGNLEEARETLLNQSNIERTNRNNMIAHDYRIATLINETLRTEPKGSAGLAVAKGIMSRLKEQYRDKSAEKLVRNLMKETRKETVINDGDRQEVREQIEPSGEETVVSGST